MNGPNHVVGMAYVDAAHKENVVSDKLTYFMYVEFLFTTVPNIVCSSQIIIYLSTALTHRCFKCNDVLT